MHDLIIIGAGAAGMSAAIYAARQKLNFAIISKDIGGQTLLSSDVENYLGFHLIDGMQLVDKFKEHLNDYDVKIIVEEALLVEKSNKGFEIKTNKNTYESKAVIIATGETPKKLNVPGEWEFYGRGVTYCAICDAPLFAGKDVAVIGGGNSAMDAALLAEKYCNKVFILTINLQLEGEIMLIEAVKKSKKIETIFNAKTKEILGNKFVSGIKFERNGKEEKLKVQGVFIEIGLTPNSSLVNVKKNEKGEIIVNTQNMTSVKGIFAAGDVTHVTEKQISVAVGEGAKAALEAIKYLQKAR